MIYALDTNTISFLLRQKFEQAIENGDEYVIPPICHYEINWYLIRKKATAQLRIFGELYENSFAKLNMYTLVTDNIGDFKNIEGLKIVNWKS